MAQRLGFDERARVEAMTSAGVSVAVTARRLGRHRSTIRRELNRGRRAGVYDAASAQAAAAVGAARPETPVLAADPELAGCVGEGLKEGASPHAIRAGLRAQGRTISAETIYRAAYDHSGSRGLSEGSWRCLGAVLSHAGADLAHNRVSGPWLRPRAAPGSSCCPAGDGVREGGAGEPGSVGEAPLVCFEFPKTAYNGAVSGLLTARTGIDAGGADPGDPWEYRDGVRVAI